MNAGISKIIKERESVKAYSDARIEHDLWEEVLSAIYWSPSSHGFEPYRVIIIDRHNKALLAELRIAMLNQQVITQADKVMIFVSLKRGVFASRDWVRKRVARKVHEVMDKHGSEADKLIEDQTEMILNSLVNGEIDGDEWAMRQAYIGLSYAINAAALLGIGSSPLDGFVRSKVERVLADMKLLDETRERVAVTATFGYPLDDKAFLHLGTRERFRQPMNHKFKEL